MDRMALLDRKLWDILGNIFDNDEIRINMDEVKNNETYVVEIMYTYWSIEKAKKDGWSRGYETVSKFITVDINDVNSISGIHKLIEDIQEQIDDF